MLLHYYTSLVAVCALAVLGGCGMPDEIADLHRQALTSERTAVHALNQLSDDVTRERVSN